MKENGAKLMKQKTNTKILISLVMLIIASCSTKSITLILNTFTTAGGIIGNC